MKVNQTDSEEIVSVARETDMKECDMETVQASKTGSFGIRKYKVLHERREDNSVIETNFDFPL